MALITLSSMVSAARGSVGGTVFSRNKGGAYTRARTTPINRNTPAQSAVRANFGATSKSWSADLTAGERTAWTSFAASNPLVNVLGASIIVSGLAMFMKLNQILGVIEYPNISTPPPDLSVPPIAAVLGATAVSATPSIVINTDAQTEVPDADYYIFATKPLAPGKTPQTSDYRYMQVFSPVALATTADITAAYVAAFGNWINGASIGVNVATVNTSTGAVTPGVVFQIVST